MGWIDGIRAALLDIDGTLLLRDRAIPGAAEALERLRLQNIPLRLVSNTTRRSCAEVAKLLGEQGIQVAASEVLLPAAMARRRILESGRRRTRLLVPSWTRDDFDGVEIVEDDPDWVVVGDLGDSFDWATMNEAFQLLMNGVSFIALHKNPYWRGSDDGFVIDAGAFIAGLEFATGVTAEVVGKPSERFYRLALDDLGARPGETLMIGDNLLTDISGAEDIGCRTALVLTGNVKDAESLDGSKPDLVLETIADLKPAAPGVG